MSNNSKIFDFGKNIVNSINLKKFNIEKLEDYSILIIPLCILLFFIKYFTMVFSPNKGVCFHNNPKNNFVVIPLFFIFMLLLLFLILLSIMNYVVDDKSYIINMLPVVIVVSSIVIIIALYYFVNCSSSNTKANLDISKYLNNNYTVQQLQLEYENLMIGLQPIYKCAVFHSGENWNSDELSDYYWNHETNTNSCDIIPNCNTYTCDSEKGAKLIDFYVAASYQSCRMPSTTNESYVSTEMLKTVLIGGARFININIYPETINETSVIPVVKSNYNDKLSENYLLLRDVLSTINKNAFLNKYSDPLILHLNLDSSWDLEIHKSVINDIAINLVTYINKQYLLDKKYNYGKDYENVLKEPICKLFNKIILCVSRNFEDGYLENTHLNELVNIKGLHKQDIIDLSPYNDGSNNETLAIILERKMISDYTDNTYVKANSNVYTIVIPDIIESHEIIPKMNASMNHGCNVFAVSYFNYFNNPDSMQIYCKYFADRKSSFLMKSKNRQHHLLNVDNSF